MLGVRSGSTHRRAARSGSTWCNKIASAGLLQPGWSRSSDRCRCTNARGHRPSVGDTLPSAHEQGKPRRAIRHAGGIGVRSRQLGLRANLSGAARPRDNPARPSGTMAAGSLCAVGCPSHAPSQPGAASGTRKPAGLERKDPVVCEGRSISCAIEPLWVSARHRADQAASRRGSAASGEPNAPG
jgi:hypothetical protein